MDATVDDLRKRCVDIGLLTHEEFSKCISKSHPQSDVEGALDLLRNCQRSGVNAWHPPHNLLTDHQIIDLKANGGINLRCGDWVILHQLGEGGMGEVFLARDLRTDSLAALKVENESNQNPARFKTEYSTLANLRHAGLPRYRQSGRWNSDPNSMYHGRSFYVMDHIHGKSLADFANGTIDFNLAVNYMRQVAEVLAYCHDFGVLHRDIKLSNVVVEATTGRVFVLDLGLCKHLHVVQEASVVAGSPHNMAPEQFREGSKLYPATDVYGLGTVFFQLLTGRPPFDGDTADLVTKHQYEQPPQVCDFRPDCPRWLNDLIVSMLSKSAADRPTNGTSVVSALRAGPATIIEPIGTHHSRADERQQRHFSRFVQLLSIGIYQLQSGTQADLHGVPKYLEAAFAAFSEATALGVTPTTTNLLSIGEFLTLIRRALSSHWDSFVTGPLADSLGKLYTCSLVYLADWLTDDFLAPPWQFKHELDALRLDVEDALSCWATAVGGGTPYHSLLDAVLTKSLQGPYSTPLPRVLRKLSLPLFHKFNHSIHARLQVNGTVDDHLLYEFIAEQATPFWRARADLLGSDATGAARDTGESLSALLNVIRPDTLLVMSTIPQAIKSLGLGKDSANREAIQNAWPNDLRHRLKRRLEELSQLAACNAAFCERFDDIMRHLRPAVDGRFRRSERIPITDFSNASGFRCELCNIDRPAESVVCQLVDLSCDMAGIGLIIPILKETDFPNPDQPDAQFSQIVDEVSNFEVEFPIRLTADSSLCRFDDCFIRLTTLTGAFVELVDLQPRWWRPASRSPQMSARLGLEIGYVQGGSINQFTGSLREHHSVETKPDERLHEGDLKD